LADNPSSQGETTPIKNHSEVLSDALARRTKRGSSSVDLTQGPVQSHILRMLGPFAIAVIALLSAGIVDTIYLGNLTGLDGSAELGVLALSAVGFAYPLTFLGNSVNIGLGAGTMSALSRAIGGGQYDKARRHAAAAILLALFVMSLTITFIWFTLPLSLDFLGASGTSREMARQYLAISLPGLAIVSIAMISNNVLRAGGEAMLPSSIMILGAILNIIIDPFLIFGWGPFPRLEVQGAAIATVTGNTIAAIFGFYIVQFRRKAVDFAHMTLSSIRHAWGIIGRVGLVAAVTNVVVPAGTFFAVAAVQRAGGDVYNAAFTLTSRAELISVGLLYGLSACIGAVTGQNGGAGLTDRVRETFRVCYKICVVWSIGMAVVLAVLADPITSLFTNDPEVKELAKTYFWIVPITIAGYGFVFVSAAGFNALGRPIYGLSFTIIRSLLLYAPLVAIGVQIDGLRGAFIGIATANILSGAISYYWSLNRAPMTAKES
jgi:putative MATE family efflux protein